MMRYALWGLLVLAGCGAPAPQPQVFKTFQITDGEGKPLPEKLTATADSAFTVAVAYQGGDLKELEGHPTLPPEEWRFFWEFEDAAGKRFRDVRPGPIGEIHAYDVLGMEAHRTGKITRTGNEERTVYWISPEKPPGDPQGMITRWGRLRFPQEPGDYTVNLVAYPAADPDVGRMNPILRTPVVAFKVPVAVVAAEAGKEPVAINTGFVKRVKPKERRWEIRAFGKLSDELAK